MSSTVVVPSSAVAAFGLTGGFLVGRWTGRRDYFQETALAIAGLVSDRAAMR